MPGTDPSQPRLVDDLVSRLLELAHLRDSEKLTEAEYQSAREEVIKELDARQGKDAS